MASLTNQKIKDTYEGLLKTSGNEAIDGAVEITDGAGNSTGVTLSNDGQVTATGTVSFGSLKDTGEDITVEKFVDEADGIANNDNDTSIPTSAAVKDYVDTNVTAQDLDFQGDNGTGAVDLDSQVLDIAGTANEIETSASGQTLTVGLVDSPTVSGTVTAGTLTDGTATLTGGTLTGDVTGDLTGDVTGDVTGSVTGNVTGNLTGNVTGNVTGDITGDVTGDLTGNVTGNLTGNVTGNTTGTVTATSVLADGVAATTQLLNDNSTKVATTAYVDAQVTAEDLDFSGNSGSGQVDLDSESLEITGSNGITTTALNNTLDIDGSTLETSINANASDISTNASNISTNAANITSNDSDISSLQTDVSTNTSNISTNASNISSNDTDIATNVSNIATNTSGIATNVTNIATNASNISSNDTDISNLQGDVSTNTGNISTNATNIASNDTDIATNASNIATNTSNISSNDTDIATNASNISANASNISSNDTDITALDGRVTANEGDITTNANNISNNDTDIATNSSNIATNTSGVATNVTNIATNTSNISTNTSNISTNTSDISTNTGNISTNATNISSNDTDIATNASGISTNASGISTNVTNIATNTSNISTNTGNIASNDTDIATNASNISTNTTNISTNATNIASNDTDIATNAGNISTNTGNISTNTTDIAGKVSKSGDTMTGSLTNTSGNVKTVIGGNDMLSFEADSGSVNNEIRVLRSGSSGPQSYIGFEEGTGYTSNKMVFNLATPGSYTENDILTLSQSNVSSSETYIDAHKQIIAQEGIYLGTTSATSANHLDDYEEGSFTPSFTNSGGLGISYYTQMGQYVKTGRQVTCWGFISVNFVPFSSSSGTVGIDGLPFNASFLSDQLGLIGNFDDDWGQDPSDFKIRKAGSNNDLIIFKEGGSGNNPVNMTGNYLTSSTVCNFSITYYTTS